MKFLVYAGIVVLLCFSLISTGNTQGENVTISWVKPLLNQDGSNLDDLAGFRVYYLWKGSADVYQNQNRITGTYQDVSADAVQVTITLPNSKYDYIYGVTAFDLSGNHSHIISKVNVTTVKVNNVFGCLK